MMLFQVPGAVMEKIAAYDPVFSKEKKKTATIKNPRNTLGLVNDLFPENVVPLELQNEWAESMNRLPSSGRFISHNTNQVHTILYVLRGVWCAYWYTKKNHPDHDKYIFGFSICYKSSEASVKKFGDPCFGWNNHKYPTLSSIATPTDVKYGRINMKKHTALVTKDNIIEWNMSAVPFYNPTHIYMPTPNTWVRALFVEKNIHIWKNNAHNPDFSRLIAQSDIYKFIANSFLLGYSAGELPTISNLADLACIMYGNVSKIIRTPFFEREANKVILELKEKLSTVEDLNVYTATHNVVDYLQSCSVLSMFVTVYGDENIDFCQRAWKSANHRFNFYDRHQRKENYILQSYKGALDWMRENIPAASLVNMMERTEDSSLIDAVRMMANLWMHQNDIDPYYHRASDMEKCKTPLTLEKPKRWRSSELHDLVNEEVFKIRNPNQPLPQDLFPAPIKVGEYTFFQPVDTHQLAKWGQAVRNCVGNSGHYAQQVKNKREFIVLALEGGQPKFTIQLKVSNSMMEVKQIVGMCNKHLTSAEQKKYTSSFSKALKIREKELTSAT